MSTARTATINTSGRRVAAGLLHKLATAPLLMLGSPGNIRTQKARAHGSSEVQSTVSGSPT